jgi:hypothetical protein
MWPEVLSEVKRFPSRVASEGAKVRHTAAQRLVAFRGEGEQRLHTLSVEALQRAGTFVGETPSWSVVRPIQDRVRPIAEKAEGALNQTFDQFMTVPFESVNEMTAKQLMSAIRELDNRRTLHNLRWHEASGKARKTVLSAVTRRLSQLDYLLVDRIGPAVVQAA